MNSAGSLNIQIPFCFPFTNLHVAMWRYIHLSTDDRHPAHSPQIRPAHARACCPRWKPADRVHRSDEICHGPYGGPSMYDTSTVAVCLSVQPEIEVRSWPCVEAMKQTTQCSGTCVAEHQGNITRHCTCMGTHVKTSYISIRRFTAWDCVRVGLAVPVLLLDTRPLMVANAAVACGAKSHVPYSCDSLNHRSPPSRPMTAAAHPTTAACRQGSAIRSSRTAPMGHMRLTARSMQRAPLGRWRGGATPTPAAGCRTALSSASSTRPCSSRCALPPPPPFWRTSAHA